MLTRFHITSVIHFTPAARCCSPNNSRSSGVRLTFAPIMGFTFVFVTYPALLSVPTFSIPLYLSCCFPFLSHSYHVSFHPVLSSQSVSTSPPFPLHHLCTFFLSQPFTSRFIYLCSCRKSHCLFERFAPEIDGC